MTDATRSFLAPKADGLNCLHDWSRKYLIDQKDLPPFVKGPAYDVYCANCGVKQSFKHRILVEAAQPTQPVNPEPEARVVIQPKPQNPDPIPLDQIKVTLDLDKYGKRYENDRRNKIVDKAIHIEGDPRWTDAMAGAAEEFVAKALGLRHSGSVDKPDAGWDLSMQGRRIQVKWTRYSDGQLLAALNQPTMADYYVLVTGGTTDEFTIPGWATLSELKASIKDLGYGKTYALSQSELRPFESLLEIRMNGV